MANLTNIAVVGTNEIVLPSAYSIESIMLCNHNGRITDINPIVTDFSITESIYHAGLMLSLNVKDVVNLMEEFQLTGHETITVNLSRKTYRSNNSSSSKIDIDNQTLSHLFYISEYPLYGKLDNRVQVYTLRGVSKHIFMSKFKRISRSFSGSIKTFVYDVLQKDLEISADDIEMTEEQAEPIKFIIPNLNPIDAIQWALRRAYDSHGAPFYCYETLGGKIKIDSHTDFNKRSNEKAYREYKEGKFFSHPPGTLEDYDERRSRILDLSSDIRMSKLLSGANGAYASKSIYVDIATKSIVTTEFDYSKEFAKMPKIGNYPTLSQGFQPEDIKAAKPYTPDQSFFQKSSVGKSLSDFKNSKINYISLNTSAFADVKIKNVPTKNAITGIFFNKKTITPNNPKNYHETTKSSKINIAQSVTENLETVIHDFDVAGDFYLNSGKIILLKIAPAEDPNSQKKGSRALLGTPTADQFFSGNYLVTAVIHNFGEDYFSSIRVKTDSFSNNFLTK